MTPFNKQDIRPLAAVSGSMGGGKDEPAEKPVPVEGVRFSFPTKPGKEVTLNVADYQSGKAMIEAAQEWATKA